LKLVKFIFNDADFGTWTNLPVIEGIGLAGESGFLVGGNSSSRSELHFVDPNHNGIFPLT